MGWAASACGMAASKFPSPLWFPPSTHWSPSSWPHHLTLVLLVSPHPPHLWHSFIDFDCTLLSPTWWSHHLISGPPITPAPKPHPHHGNYAHGRPSQVRGKRHDRLNLIFTHPYFPPRPPWTLSAHMYFINLYRLGDGAITLCASRGCETYPGRRWIWTWNEQWRTGVVTRRPPRKLVGCGRYISMCRTTFWECHHVYCKHYTCKYCSGRRERRENFSGLRWHAIIMWPSCDGQAQVQ